MIWQISLAIIALAFVALVIFLIKTLKAAEQSLVTTTQTLQEVQKTIDDLSSELKQVVKQANDITGDVQLKMRQIDPMMETVKNAGEVLNEVTLAAKQVSSSVIERFKKPSSPRSKTPRPDVAASSANIVKEAPEQTTSHKENTGKKNVDWTKLVDVAAVVWQKYRS
jgi:uncharacterized protein YoxC